MLPISKAFEPQYTILKYFDFKAAACLVSATGVSANADGLKIVKAGTPYPSNDASCKGFLLYDVDVTQGDAPGAYVFEGSIDSAKVTANDVTIADAAKTAVPRVTFF